LKEDSEKTPRKKPASFSDPNQRAALPAPLFLGLFSLKGEMLEGHFCTPFTSQKEPLQRRYHSILLGLSMLRCCHPLCDGEGSYLDLRNTWERWQFWKPASAELCVVAETGFYLSRSQYLLLAKDYFSSFQGLSSPSL
jgi:hypothetical protein